MARPKSDIDRRILRAARKRFLHEGVDAASLRDIARDAKTSVGMIQYWFPSKDALFMSVVEEIYGGLLAGISRALEPDVPIEQRVQRLYLRLGTMTDDEFTVLRIVLREAMVSAKRLKKLSKRFLDGHVPLIIATVVEGMATGKFDSTLPPMAAAMALAALGIVPAVMMKRIAPVLPPGLDLPSPERGAALFAEVLFHGLSPRKRKR